MTGRKLTALSLTLCCTILGGATFITSMQTVRGGAQTGAGAAAQPSRPLARLNEKARAARSGDEAAVRELADEVLGQLNADQAPAGLADAIRERLVSAEMRYRAGNGKAISDAKIVRMVNRLAREVGAPAFARTDVFELRRMKTGLLPFTSDLQTREVGGPSGRRNPRELTMAPLEATYFALALVQQKLHNPEYQMTQDEWVQLHGGKRKSDSTGKFREKMKERRNDSNRTRELQKAFADGLAAKSPLQLLELPATLLDSLGVER